MSKARLECGICFEETEQGAHSELCGVHFLCNACWAKLLARELVRKRKSPLMLRCPGARCAVRLTHADVARLADDETRNQYDALLETVPRHRPSTLKDFGYILDRRGVLRHAAAGTRFHFVSHRHYAALGELVEQTMLERLRSSRRIRTLSVPISVAAESSAARVLGRSVGLVYPGVTWEEHAAAAERQRRAEVADRLKRGLAIPASLKQAKPFRMHAWSRPVLPPLQFQESDPHAEGRQSVSASLLATEDIFANDKGVVVIVPSSEAHGQGMWTRSACINDSLGTGSLDGVIAAAQRAGYGVLVTQPYCTAMARRPRALDAAGSAVRRAHAPSQQDQAAPQGSATAWEDTAASAGQGAGEGHALALRRRLMRAASMQISHEGAAAGQSQVARSMPGLRMSGPKGRVIQLPRFRGQGKGEGASEAHGKHFADLVQNLTSLREGEEVHLPGVPDAEVDGTFATAAAHRRRNAAGDVALETRALARYFMASGGGVAQTASEVEAAASTKGHDSPQRRTSHGTAAPRWRLGSMLAAQAKERRASERSADTAGGYSVEEEDDDKASTATLAADLPPAVRTRAPIHLAPRVRGSETPTQHMIYVWDYVLTRCAAPTFAFIAHGSGGFPTVELFRQREEAVLGKTACVCFADAVTWRHPSDSDALQTFWTSHCMQWSCSLDRRGETQYVHEALTPSVSAGTMDHNSVPRSALDHMMEYIDRKVAREESVAASQSAAGDEREGV